MSISKILTAGLEPATVLQLGYTTVTLGYTPVKTLNRKRNHIILYHHYKYPVPVNGFRIVNYLF